MSTNKFEVGCVWRPKRGRPELLPVVVTQSSPKPLLVRVGTDPDARRLQVGTWVTVAQLRSTYVYVGQVKSWPKDKTQGETIDEVMNARRVEVEARRAA